MTGTFLPEYAYNFAVRSVVSGQERTDTFYFHVLGKSTFSLASEPPHLVIVSVLFPGIRHKWL
jgi:hypothetical protein